MTAVNKLDTQQVDELKAIIAENQKLLQQLNNGVHSQNEINQIISQLTNQPVDDSVEIRLPLYSDFGRNIHLGQHVFINAGVTFVDMGGIFIADDVLIGPKATLVSVNHPLKASERHNVELKFATTLG